MIAAQQWAHLSLPQYSMGEMRNNPLQKLNSVRLLLEEWLLLRSIHRSEAACLLIALSSAESGVAASSNGQYTRV